MMPIAVSAQETDTVKSVTVRSSTTPSKIIVQNFDTLQRKFFITQDATSLLEANSNAYVRNYGVSNLSTLSIRGSSVAQTNVVWNGVPIQNTMLGLTDLSTVPGFFFDKMSLRPTGFNSNGGLQSIAGSLELKNKLGFTPKRELTLGTLSGYESFQNGIFGGNIKVSDTNYSLRVKYYNRQGLNQYSFYNDYTAHEDTISNAYARQEQVLVDFNVQPRKHHLLSFHYWGINNKREIAPLAFETNEERQEENNIKRVGIQYKYSKKRFFLNTNAGITIDSFIYTDNYTNQKTAARVINSSLIVSTQYFLNEKSEFGISYNRQFSRFWQRTNEAQLSQNAFQLFYKNNNIWQAVQLNLFIQKQLNSIGENPITFGGRIARNIGKQLFFYSSFNTNFRIPTLNELYYFPGGNENLKPERSQNLELGGQIDFEVLDFKVSNKTAFYSRWVDDWVLWSGAAIFFPDNIAKVWSCGVENKISLYYQTGEWYFGNHFLIAYNSATSLRPHFVNDQSVGKQIPYVPRLSWRNNFYIDYRRFSFQLNNSYVGYRFITRDETEFVNPYHLLNAYIGYKHGIKKLQFELQFRCNNLSNQHYESMRGRIMPGRNYGISLLTELRY